MENRRIVYHEDGKLHIAQANPYCGLTMDEIVKLTVPSGEPFEIIDSTDLPDDHTYREAWELEGVKVKVNFEKAKEIAKDNLRTSRKNLLEALDVEFIRNLETGKSNESVIKEKQRLRDITKEVDKCNNLKEVSAINLS